MLGTLPEERNVRRQGCRGRVSPAAYPGDFQTECAAKMHDGRMQRELGGSRPQLKLIAMAMTLMAVVAGGSHVHGEGSRATGRGTVQGAGSVPLLARSLGRLEAQQVQHLLHRDLTAKPVEVDPWHNIFLLGPVGW